MCLFPPKPPKKAKAPSKVPFIVREKGVSQVPSHLQIRRNDSTSSFQHFDAFISSSEHKRLEEHAKLESQRRAEKAELERYQAAEKAQQEKTCQIEKAELERLRLAEREGRHRSIREEKERVERLERELNVLKLKGGTGWESIEKHGNSYRYSSNLELFQTQHQHQWLGLNEKQARKYRQNEILDEIEFVQNLGKKFPSSPSSAAAITTPTQSNEEKEKEDKLLLEIGKLRSELGEIRLEGRLAQVRAEGMKGGCEAGEMKVRMEFENKRVLEAELGARGRREEGSWERGRTNKARIWEKELSDEIDSERFMDGRFMRETGNLMKVVREAEATINLTALARLPGRWSFAISSPSSPPDTQQIQRQPQPPPTVVPNQNLVQLDTRLQDIELLKLHDRIQKLEDPAPVPRFEFSDPVKVWERANRQHSWEQEREMRERLERMEERQYQDFRTKEREKRWAREREREEEEREWRDRMRDERAGLNQRFGQGGGGTRGGWSGY